MAREAEEFAQPAGVLLGDDSLGQAGFDFAGEEAQHLAERQVRIAYAGLGVAVAEGDEQVGVEVLGTAGEFGDQGRLAGAGLAGDEDHLALASEGAGQKRL